MKTNSILLLSALAILAAASCKSGNQDQVVKTQVEVITLKDTSCVMEISAPATIQGLQDVAIYPQVSGRITAIRVSEGQFVNKGDVLFEIDDVPYKAAYDAALAQVEVSKAQLETSRLTCQSKQNLYEKGIISEYQYKLARNDVTTAEARLGQSNASLKDAANNLSFTKVRTMGKGYIGSLPYKVGSLVGTNITSPLTIVSDNSSIYADFSIPENTYLTIQDNSNEGLNVKNMPLQLRTNLGTRFEHEGRLHSLSGLISNQTGSIPARAIFPNPDRKLLSGGSCQVILSYLQDNVIVVPRSAMKEIQDKLFVFVVKDGKLVQTEVQASRLNSSQWALEADEDGKLPVSAGDVITKTTNRLMDGMPVEIIK